MFSLDLPNALILVAGLAAVVAIVTTVHAFLRAEPSAHIIVKEDGRTEQFRVTTSELEEVRATLERFKKRYQKDAHQQERPAKTAGSIGN